MSFISLNFLSLQFSSKCAFIFFNNNSAFISAKRLGGKRILRLSTQRTRAVLQNGAERP